MDVSVNEALRASARETYGPELEAIDAEAAAEWAEFEAYCERHGLDPDRLASHWAFDGRPRFSDDPESVDGL